MRRFNTILSVLAVSVPLILAFVVEMLPRNMTLVILTLGLVLMGLLGLAVALFGRQPPP
ncbi:MAG: hypothetical protein OXO56_13040 [Gammaproteobacteria bacterium]|nr:hypothetical protein [Gammaproteobacteria bacterium]